MAALLAIKFIQIIDKLDVLCWKPKTKEWEVINPIVEEKAKQWELKSIPLINGKENVVFVYDEKTNVFKLKN